MAVPLTDQLEHDQDVDLIEAIQVGDDSALSDLIDRNERWVRGVVFAAIGDAGALDDVMQKVWLSVWQRSKQLDDTRRWRHWLYRTARNAAIDFGRKKTRRRKLWKALSQEMAGHDAGAQPGPGPDRMAAIKEEHRRVLEGIHSMPALYREPFVLRHLEGWSYRQIAEALDLPVDTVGTRLVRARRLLQELMGAEDGESS